MSARRRCSGESEEEEEEERDALAAAGAAARRRLAGRTKKSAMVLGAVGVGGNGAIGSGFGEISGGGEGVLLGSRSSLRFCCGGLTKAVGTGPARPGFGLSRYQISLNSKFKFKFKKIKNSQKIL